jgi:hypothetical protein
MALGRRATIVLLAALLAGAAVVVSVLNRPDPSPSPGTSPSWVGVRQGDRVPVYLELSAARLAALGADDPDRVVYALVSFARYLTPAEVATVVGAAPGVASVTGHARVPLPGRQTQLVSLPAIQLPDDLRRSMAEVADRKDTDAEYYAALAAAEPDGAMGEIYRSNVEVARAEAEAYRQGCGCVYGLVVRGDAAALAALAENADVRAVDPAAEVADPRAAVFAPLLPEHVDRVTPLADDALPPLSPTGSAAAAEAAVGAGPPRLARDLRRRGRRRTSCRLAGSLVLPRQRRPASTT